MKKIFLFFRILFFLPFLGFFIFVVAGSFATSQNQERTEGFIPVDAKVVESRVRKIDSAGIDRSSRTEYIPYLLYQYDIEGKTYFSDKIGYNAKPRFNNEDGTAKSFITNYPVGKGIVAYFNPDNPQESVLIIGKNKHPIVMVIFAVVLCLFFFAFIVLPGILSLMN